MSAVKGALHLAVEPEQWTLRLRDGSEILVLAHAYRVEGDDCVFSLLFRGSPNYDVTSLRIPLRMLEPNYFDPVPD